MKKIFLLLTIIFCALTKSYGKYINFSDSTVISLITCSPGKEVYAKFGHTAIRVKDDVNDIDIVFNYGIFDFNTHNFYLKFVKGETDYKLAAYEFIYFLPEYVERNSYVWEQILNLTLEEKNELIELLLINYEPQNRIYRYNFIYDNCSTRARDIIVKAIDGRVEYHLIQDKQTFREWVEMYVGRGTWVMFGIDMVFGQDADVIASRKESMFLPEGLMNEFQDADIVAQDGFTKRNLISEIRILNNKLPEDPKNLPFIFTPIVVCTLLLLIGITLVFFRHRLRITGKVFDTIIYVLTGLIGLVVFYLMFFSLHPMVKNNLNLLWLNPLFLIVAVTQWFKRLNPATFFLQVINAVMLLIALITFALSKQYINIAFIPLILLLLIRTLLYIRNRILKNRSKSNEKYARQPSI